MYQIQDSFLCLNPRKTKQFSLWPLQAIHPLSVLSVLLNTRSPNQWLLIWWLLSYINVSKYLYISQEFEQWTILSTNLYLIIVSSVQLLSSVRLFATPWIAARQASLSITNSRSSLKLMPIESVIPSSHLTSVVPFSSCPQSLPTSESFPMS